MEQVMQAPHIRREEKRMQAASVPKRTLEQPPLHHAMASAKRKARGCPTNCTTSFSQAELTHFMCGD